MTSRIIEIQPVHSGWQVRGADAASAPPYFTGPSAIEHAIEFAWERACQRTGEIRLLARSGEVITAMPFGPTQNSPAFVNPVKLRDRRAWRQS
ncbi:MAG: hypothetical protein H0X40_02090 [Chthoniobacterales bacterium]|nr:hypothetical protein [Chthoniobacterales bacterium]